MSQLPDLAKVFFTFDGHSEHAEDAACLSLDKIYPSQAERWTEVRDQHFLAFDLLTQVATAPATSPTVEVPVWRGWGLGRPIVFEAQQTCELTLKTVLLPKVMESHKLKVLLAEERKLGGSQADQLTRKWEDKFARLMDHHAGRYPEDLNGKDFFENTCCVSPSALKLAVAEFRELVEVRHASRLSLAT